MKVSMYHACLVGLVACLSMGAVKAEDQAKAKVEASLLKDVLKEKVLSTSPDGKYAIVSVVLKGGSLDKYENYVKMVPHLAEAVAYDWTYLKDLKSGEIVPLQERGVGRVEMTQHYGEEKVYADWVGGSAIFRLSVGDEKVWDRKLYVKRMVPDSGKVFFQQPDLPSDREILQFIRKLTSETEHATDTPEYMVWNLSLPGDFKFKAGGELIEFTLTYELMNTALVRGKDARYTLTFETKDWFRYDLMKIERNGPASENAYKPNEDHLILYARGKK